MAVLLESIFVADAVQSTNWLARKSLLVIVERAINVTKIYIVSLAWAQVCMGTKI